MKHCNIIQEVKKRSGALLYWCKAHHCEAPNNICPKQSELPINHGKIKLESLNNLAIWQSVDDDGTLLPLYHVHQGSKPKTIDDDYGCIELDGVEVLASSGLAYFETVKKGLQIEYLECNHCGYPHTDEGWFAVNTHAKHLCSHCGRNFVQKTRGIGNPWAKFKIDNIIEPATVAIPMEELKKCDKIEKWKTRPSLYWSYDRSELSGVHIHGWLNGKKVVDDTFKYSQSELEQVEELIRQLQTDVVSQQQEILARIEQPNK